jgi:hypothetical protein
VTGQGSVTVVARSLQVASKMQVQIRGVLPFFVAKDSTSDLSAVVSMQMTKMMDRRCHDVAANQHTLDLF